MTVIPKDKSQLISLLNKQPNFQVLQVLSDSPKEAAEIIKKLSNPKVTVIVIKS
jgi:ApbE superfamily uncharacterized protein (UPF0280 family)